MLLVVEVERDCSKPRVEAVVRDGWTSGDRTRVVILVDGTEHEGWLIVTKGMKPCSDHTIMSPVSIGHPYLWWDFLFSGCMGGPTETKECLACSAIIQGFHVVQVLDLG